MAAENFSGKRANVSLSDLHHSRRRGRKFFWRTFIFIALIFGLSLFLRWLLWSPWLQVEHIGYSGLSRIGEEEIENFISAQIAGGSFRQRLFGQESILAWHKQSVWTRPVYLPAISEIRVSRDLWQRTLSVEVQESRPAGIWCSTMDEFEKCAWFDESGNVIERAPLAQGSLIPVVRDATGRHLIIGQPIFESPEKTKNALSVFKVLSAEHVAIEEVRFERAVGDEIKVVQTSGPEMYFSLRFPADATQGPLHALREKGWDSLTYLDFRIENRVYYK